MPTRRQFTAASFALGAWGALAKSLAFAAPPSPFNLLLNDVLNNPSLLEGARSEGEELREMYEFHVTKAIAPRTAPSERPISDDAIKTIILFEVTGKIRYEQKFQRPIWPGGESGITVGVGYDLGYVTPKWLKDDWGKIISPSDLATLKDACGIRGEAANRALGKFKSVTIPWEKANPQFRNYLLPLYVAETLARLPNANKLSDDSLGAMVSLVYNRGAGGFRSPKPQYKEMRAILQHMEVEKYELVPEEFRKMTRLWPKTRGLLTRRELEARLFEKGLPV
ncbi:hypothetical protein SB778_31110 [Paraburkholderia sp. SIMBA_050]